MEKKKELIRFALVVASSIVLAIGVYVAMWEGEIANGAWLAALSAHLKIFHDPS